MTVTGEKNAGELGFILPHEHIFCDLRPLVDRQVGEEFDSPRLHQNSKLNADNETPTILCRTSKIAVFCCCDRLLDFGVEYIIFTPKVDKQLTVNTEFSVNYRYNVDPAILHIPADVSPMQ